MHERIQSRMLKHTRKEKATSNSCWSALVKREKDDVTQSIKAVRVIYH
jgi:hypothetical protein